VSVVYDISMHRFLDAEASAFTETKGDYTRKPSVLPAEGFQL